MPIINLAAGDQPVEQIVDITSLFEKALQAIYKNHGGAQPLVEKHLFEISNKTLQHGIDKTFTAAGMEFGKQNADFISQFKTNASIFAAFKGHCQSKDVAAQLLRPDGTLRSFSEFKKEALKLSKEYNKTWLQTEYNTAVRSARMAANWKQFERTKHLYPNLEYMPSTAANPRDAHKALWHTIRPIDDPFWNIYYPPGDWNCKCSVRAVKGEATNVPDVLPTVSPVFRNNPGKTAEIVNLHEHSYYKHTDPVLRDKVANAGKIIADDVKVKRHEGKNGGYLDIPFELKQNSQEIKKNLEAYLILADNGYQYKILNVVQKVGYKNPDAFNIKNGVFSDVKVPVTDNIKGAIQNAISSANKQMAQEVVIRFTHRHSDDEIVVGVRNSFMKGRNSKIKTVILIYFDQVIKTIDVATLRKSI